MNNPINNYINHIVFVIDESGSMEGLTQKVVKVFDNQISHLAQRSKELDQETRVSVYLFNTSTRCIIYDKDVLRLPSLSSFYSPGGGTALLDATLKSIQDLEKTPELYGDHAFLVYVMTDGQETERRAGFPALSSKLKSLPDNWTIAVMVPSQDGVFEAKKHGFPANNIAVWSTDSAGLERAGDEMKIATDSFMRSRATGLRGTKSLFSLDLSNLNSNVVKLTLDSLKSSEFMLIPVHKDSAIKVCVESWTQKPYTIGSAYYQLTKSETVQPYKQVCIQEKKTGKVYSGDKARQIIGLPNSTVKISAMNHPLYDIFLQSTSSNRKLVSGTKLIVLL